jgi:four helix bundle protein
MPITPFTLTEAFFDGGDMTMNNFRTFDSAAAFWRISRTLVLGGALKEQLSRAALSIALNLAEGRGKATRRDQVRFFSIAMGSVRECQAILMLAELEGGEAWELLDSTAAQLYRLIENS